VGLLNSDVDAFDYASLDALRLDLLGAGFEVMAGSQGRRWAGPLPSELWALTRARDMEISIRDGWPHMHPHVFVAGLSGEHVSDEGLVCLWNDDDLSLEWRTWEGIHHRLVAWAERTRLGFDLVDAGLDAFMGFKGRTSAIATVDLDRLAGGGFSDGKGGRMHGVWRNEGCLDLAPGRANVGQLAGRWFYRHTMSSPPRNLNEFVAALSPQQQKAFDSGRLRQSQSGEGRLAVAALIWPRHGAFDIVVIAFEDRNRNEVVAVLEPARVDKATLMRRAGLDAPALMGKAAVIFGVGAVGGHAGLLLAENGLGRLRLVDDERLRPSNVVRHIASDFWVGERKAIAVSVEIKHHAPWTEVEPCAARMFGPTAIRHAVEGMDLIIDTTGHASFSAGVAQLAWDEGIPLVSAALYRKGALGRVRRQTKSDVPLMTRSRVTGFLQIPADQSDDKVVLEVGCSSPVNLAAPSSVASLAAAAARTAVDVLVARFEYPSEFIEVYSALAPPFDKVGQIAS
jgi:molybdopterin/thiamine biosynthesis adenylyltransferase